MIAKQKQLDSAKYAELIQLIQCKFSKTQASLITRYAEFFCVSMDESDFELKSVSELYSAITSLWNYIGDFQAECEIRIYSPSLENQGWKSKHTVIELVHIDMPFLVDSIRMELNRLGVNIHLHVHTLISVERNARDKVTAISVPQPGDYQASISPMYLEIDRQLDDTELELIKTNLEEVLADVRAAVGDWEAMKSKLAESIERLDKLPKALKTAKNTECKDFLSWILDNHFTLLGYAYYQLKTDKKAKYLQPEKNSCLGLKTRPSSQPHAYALKDLPKQAQKLILTNDELLVLTKLTALSRVHRPAHIDYIGVKRVDKKGNIIGEDRFIGLYTSAAYYLNPRSIPVLRQKIQSVQDKSGFFPPQYEYKVLKSILETYPRDELFQTSVEELFNISHGILQIQERRIIRLFVRQDLYGRFFSCLVYVPREIYNTNIRHKITKILAEAFSVVSKPQFSTHFSDSALARIHFILPVLNAEKIKYDLKQIEEKLFQATLSWKDRFKESLVDECGEANGKILLEKYVRAFPLSYREEFSVETTIIDISHLQSLNEQKRLNMRLYETQEDEKGIIRFKLFYYDEPKALSDVLPMLENMGLNVIETKPYKITRNDKSIFWINDFVMQHRASKKLDVTKIKDVFHDAFRHIWLEDAENDGFNQLVLSAFLSWRQIAILRAYAKYMWQIGSNFSLTYIGETLHAYPQIARLLINYFYEKFDPQKKSTLAKQKAAHNKILAALENVSNLDQDRILHRYMELISVTTRTNFFQLDSQAKEKNYIAFKLNSAQINDIPKPAPMFEIFVYSPRMEGVHLRRGKIARGGLRWSDRREDFRTEILGLVKAQQVKNTVIVPAGAKGGFVCKRNLTMLNREEQLQEGIACYKIFISALLDITDNMLEGKLVPPAQVIRHDDDDPYLVVAADKGTATFSDIANQISTDYGFWLGDAFASGGSAGYDHKKMGITAKGAWESVKRHFMEMNIDCQSQDFSVVGIGDMSGDVFGNGMLCSRHIRLVAAFNHQHIFIDPDPDSEKSYQERERLFGLPRSSWEDYDTKLISQGGGIFSRQSKSITLTSQIKKLLDVNQPALTPNELINSILKAKVDLLWNGGIGTYIKAKSETHADVGDRTNDVLRVNAIDLRCKVIGEGGNLGVTQLGRIEYMLNGGRANTDFIDNAGGVNCSDNEVNIKILLNQLVSAGDMTLKQRNKLLLSMTDEISQIVLRENFQQAQSISISQSRSSIMVKELIRFIHWLEKEEKLDRELEFLPDDEALLERQAQGKGLTRAELAVLMAYGKMRLKQELCIPEIASEAFYQSILADYFPAAIRKNFAKSIQTHPLKDEIIAMSLANQMLDYLGSNFVFRAVDETGASAAEVANCFSIGRELFDMKQIWAQIEQLGHSVPATIHYQMFYQTQRMMRRTTRWFLRHKSKALTIKNAIEYFSLGVKQLEKNICHLLEEKENKEILENCSKWIEHGVPKQLAERIAYLSSLYSVLDIVEVARATSQKVDLVAEVYFKLGAKLELHWFLEQINLQPVDNHWQAFARASFREDLDSQQKSLAVAVLRKAKKSLKAEELIEGWINSNADLLTRWKHMLADFRTSKRHEFAKFSVVLRELFILSQSSRNPVDGVFH